MQDQQEQVDFRVNLDSRAGRILEAASELGAAEVGLREVLLAALKSEDGDIRNVFHQSLRPASRIAQLVEIIESNWPDVDPARTATLAGVLLACVETGAPNENYPVVAEMILAVLLENLSPEERASLSDDLDFDRAAKLFRQRAAELANERTNSRKGNSANGQKSRDTDRPFELPPQLAFCEDLTFRMRRAPVDGEFPFDADPQYERLFQELARAFHRSQTKHVVLVGERGVGQSAVIAELARRSATGQIPFLNQKRIVSIDCRYVPLEESRERFAGILSSVAARNDLIVCVDGFANLLRSDRRSSNKGMMLSALSRVPCHLLGRLSPSEYEELISGDLEMQEFFNRIDVEEPSLETARKLLAHFARGLEHKFRVAIEPNAIDRSVVLSANYILNERLPSKAVRILNRVCEDIDFERSQLGAVRQRVTAEDVVQVVAEASGVPAETLRGIAAKSDYEESLRTMIVGQEDAVREVATELSLIKAGLTERNKPASVMLFVGQTGTGKTEMGKALARFYSSSKKVRTYTLGNFVEPHSVSGLIGVPAGYVGHDQGGRLINELNADPYCVFLLDEADKAHPDVLQPFLNLFDEGWIRDQRGVQAHADKAIFILTTNVGQRMILDMAKQGKTSQEIADRMKEALAQIRHGKSNRPVFAPEFLARIKRVVVFKPLDRDAMQGICQKLVSQMQQDWKEKRQRTLEVPETLIDFIAEKSHMRNEKSDGREGGRIVRKLIADWIEAPIQRSISEQTDEYRATDSVKLEIEVVEPPNSTDDKSPPPAAVDPKIRVTFQMRSTD